MADRDLASLPKAHLHVHLESAIRWDTLRDLGTVHGVPVPDPPVAGGPAFADFSQFAAYNALVRDCLRRPADFARVAEEFCADEAAQGARYVEVTLTAAAHGRRLGSLDAPLAATLDGLARGSDTHGITCRVILDHSRRRPVQWARDTLALATRYAERGVVAIGMAGDEAYPLAPFATVVEAAADAGVRLVHHAGEMGGAASIREALTVGRADRIGHGIRMLDDADLVAEVRRRALPLEVCPSSNVALGLVDGIGAHPLPAMHAAGLWVTVNTDIPSVAATTLTGEYAALRTHHGYDDAALADLARAAVDASFAPSVVRSRLHREIDAWLGLSPRP
jgi:adenosine deaminase